MSAQNRKKPLNQLVNEIDDDDEQICGGIHAIEGAQNSLEIASLARFAVDEHNKKENALLEFGKVVSAKRQMVAGFLYYITMEVTDGGHKKEYEAKVYVRSWENFKGLEEFKPMKPL